MKACSKCGIVKPLTDFYQDTRTISNVRSKCKACECEEAKARKKPYEPRLANCQVCGDAFKVPKNGSDGTKCKECRYQLELAQQRWRKRYERMPEELIQFVYGSPVPRLSSVLSKFPENPSAMVYGWSGRQPNESMS